MDLMYDLINNGDKEGIRLLIQADPEAIHRTCVRIGIPNSRQCRNHTPMSYAVLIGDFDTVKLLVELGADKDDISFATTREIIEYGMKLGIPIDLEAKLRLAAGKNDLGLAMFLLTRGARATDALVPAIQGGHVDMLSLLLESDADANAPNTDGRTPLMIASSYKHSELASQMAELLLIHGADANLRNNDKAQISALRSAVNNRNKTLIKLLLASGAKPLNQEVEEVVEEAKVEQPKNKQYPCCLIIFIIILLNALLILWYKFPPGHK